MDLKASGSGVEAGAQIKLNLKNDPTFRQALEDRLKGHLGALVKDVHGFFGECITALRRKHKNDNLRAVLLLDRSSRSGDLDQRQRGGGRAGDVV